MRAKVNFSHKIPLLSADESSFKITGLSFQTYKVSYVKFLSKRCFSYQHNLNSLPIRGVFKTFMVWSRDLSRDQIIR